MTLLGWLTFLLRSHSHSPAFLDFFDFPSNSLHDALFHHIDYDHCHAD